MKLIPFESVSSIPTGKGNESTVHSNSELIEVADLFILNTVRGIIKPYYTGLSAFMFDAQIKFGFDKRYKLDSVEFSRPFSFLNGGGLFWNDVNLLCSTLLEAHDILLKAGIPTKEIDVGLEASEIGVSFFSSDYEGDLAVSLDAVTVHLHRAIET